MPPPQRGQVVFLVLMMFSLVEGLVGKAEGYVEAPKEDGTHLVLLVVEQVLECVPAVVARAEQHPLDVLVDAHLTSLQRWLMTHDGDSPLSQTT